MSESDDSLQTLMDLGLTFLQAKIFITLTKLGRAQVTEISKNSKIARQDIYRLMPVLLKLGLAEKLICTPIMYRAVPLNYGVSMLLEQKTEEYTKLETKAKLLVANYPENHSKLEIPDDIEFVITSEKKLLFKNIEKTLLQVEESIDIICLIDGLKLVFYFLPYLHRTRPGVIIRIITNRSGKSLIKKLALKEMKTLGLYVKYLSDKLPVVMAIFDNKKASICMSSGEIVPSLWTNNYNVVKIAQVYFASMWNRSKDIKANDSAHDQIVELITKQKSSAY